MKDHERIRLEKRLDYPALHERIHTLLLAYGLVNLYLTEALADVALEQFAKVVNDPDHGSEGLGAEGLGGWVKTNGMAAEETKP